MAIRITGGPVRSAWVVTILLALPLLSAAGAFSEPTSDVRIGGPPNQAELAAFAEAGGGLVIDLRTAAEGIEETREEAEAQGLRYENFPLGRDPAPESLVDEVGATLEAARAAGEKVLLHCASGNRAGEVWALHRIRQGVDPDQALAEARDAGTTGERLDDLERRLRSD